MTTLFDDPAIAGADMLLALSRCQLHSRQHCHASTETRLVLLLLSRVCQVRSIGVVTAPGSMAEDVDPHPEPRCCKLPASPATGGLVLALSPAPTLA